jgi:hypothetical protein
MDRDRALKYDKVSEVSKPPAEENKKKKEARLRNVEGVL